MKGIYGTVDQDFGCFYGDLVVAAKPSWKSVDNEGTLASQVAGRYRHAEGQEDDDLAEWMVRVRRPKIHDREEAFWCKRMFNNQNSACKLDDEFTLDQLGQHFAGGAQGWGLSQVHAGVDWQGGWTGI